MAELPSHLHSGWNSHEVRLRLAEILESPHFAHAPQLRTFLEFLVIGSLEGREDELKEANLGRDVFRRGAGYDPRSDAIVRVQASILRKRLATYYESEGKHANLRILLPKGGYVPQFVPVPAEELPPHVHASAADLPLQSISGPSGAPAASPSLQPTRRGLFRGGLAFAGGIAAASSGFLLREWSSGAGPVALARSEDTFDARTVSPRIWGSLLSPALPIQLAFGCPQFFSGGGLYLRDVMVNGTEDDSSGRLHDLSRSLKRYLIPAPNTYTGVGEMRGIHHMTRFLAYRGIDAGFDNASLLTPEAIHGKTLILVASHRFRTLLDLLDLPKAITSEYENSGGFSVLGAGDELPQSYRPRGSGGAQESFGVVSFWNRPSTGGKIMLLSGIDSWATYGAAVYITSQPHLKELESRLAGDFSESANGVQVLVHMEGRDNQLSHVRYHTHRVV